MAGTPLGMPWFNKNSAHFGGLLMLTWAAHARYVKARVMWKRLERLDKALFDLQMLETSD